MKSPSNLPAPYRPWLAFLRIHRRRIVTGCLAVAVGGWVAFWLASSGLWYWLFRIVAPGMVIGVTVRLIWEAIDGDAPLPEHGWKGEEMHLSRAGEQRVNVNGDPEPDGNPEKYSARGVPASPATPEVLVDEYSPEYISALVAKMEKENRERQRRGPEFEVEG